MLGAFANAFRTPDLRKKLLFVLLIIAVFRLGSQIPTPGVNVANVQDCFDQASKEGGVYNLINLFSGGALLQLTIFALGIMPYITASIILQLLVVVIPRLEALKKEGQAGQAKITQYTRYLTLALAILQATGIVALARSGSLLQNCTKDLVYDQHISTALIMVVTMTAGTAVIMWLGELITDRGIGNGMSILIFTQVVARFPTELWQLRIAKGWFLFAAVIVVGFAIIAAVIFIEQAQRRIPVQYARRMVGRKMFGGSSTYIPLKVNQAGVIPVIFASSLLYLPAMIVQFNQSTDTRVVKWIATYFVRGDHPLYMIVVLPADRVLHLLLRRDHLQPGGSRRQHEEVRRLHPRDPGGQADGGVPQLRPVPHHAARSPVPGADRADPVDRARAGQRDPELPVRRHLAADHGRRRPRHGEADREPAPAAQLRRIPR